MLDFNAPRASFLNKTTLDLTSKFGFPVDSFNEFEVNNIGDYEDLLCFVSSMLSISIMDIDAACSEIINLTAIRALDWAAVVSSRNEPKKNRTIDSFSDTEAKSNTRFTKGELHRLNALLFSTQPTSFFVWHTYRFTYEEMLLIALDYMANGTKYQKMKQTYGGDWTTYGYPINFFARYLYQKYYHRLTGQSINYWAPNADTFRRTIWKKVCFDEEED